MPREQFAEHNENTILCQFTSLILYSMSFVVASFWVVGKFSEELFSLFSPETLNNNFLLPATAAAAALLNYSHPKNTENLWIFEKLIILSDRVIIHCSQPVEAKVLLCAIHFNFDCFSNKVI